MQTDILIVGSGAAGLYCALQLPQDKQITIIPKDDAENSDSFLAQGGMCVLRDDEDFDSFYEDTMRAGHYENNPDSVRVMISSSQQVAKELIGYGVDFERDEQGNLCYTREGAHSAHRILFHEDVTGREITQTLLKRALERSNITLLEHHTMVDILCAENRCAGIVMQTPEGEIVPVWADYTVWACGGIGGLYQHSTNFPHITGDALAIALKHDIRLEHPEYVQIHPTTLYSTKPGRRFLISESVRGEGAVLYNAKMERFVDELLPRDVVAKAIREQMKKDGTPYVWLSMERIPAPVIRHHFPNIYQRCLEEGYDVTKECIPVVPAQHYFMGGVQVDLESRTSMDRLYAVGETSCNGVHGKNRLASNSLLESMVFAARAAEDITGHYLKNTLTQSDTLFHPTEYTDIPTLEAHYHAAVLQEIERMTQAHE